MSGPTVIDRAQSCQPGLNTLLITGYAEAIRTGGVAGIPMLAKPFKVAELARRIAEILQHSRSEAGTGAAGVRDNGLLKSALA
jgi:DNA-binding response OmpR family regulator